MLTPLGMQSTLETHDMEQFGDFDQVDCTLEVVQGEIQFCQGSMSTKIVNVVSGVSQLGPTLMKNAQLAVST